MFAFDSTHTLRMTLAASVLALAAGGTAAFAQDTTGNTPAHAAHVRHGGDPLAATMFRVKSQLALNSSQQLQWDNAVAQSKSARAQGSALRKGVKGQFDAELAKDQPDLASVAGAADAARAQGRQLRTSARDAWLGVYANLTPAQKATVRDALRAQSSRMDERRASHRMPS